MVRGPRAAVKVSNSLVEECANALSVGPRRGIVWVRPHFGASAVSASDTPRPEPVTGRTFESSPGKGLGQFFTGLLFVALGALIVAWRLSGYAITNRRPTWFITIVAGLVVLLGGFFAITAVVQMLRTRRVVIGEDRVQVLQRSGGAEVVVAQVLYANVAALGVENNEAGHHVQVVLADRAAEGTYDTAGLIRAWQNGEGHNLVLANHFRGTPQDVCTAIDDAALAWRQAREAEAEAKGKAAREPGPSATPPGA
jgi:hypothetical protein